MPRLFIASALPAAIRAQLAALQTVLAGARWVRAEQMHLTLRFIGAVDANRTQQIAAALESVRAPEFELNIQGVGYFPPRRAPRVLWAGITENPRLQQLYREIEGTLGQIGLVPESRPFAGHITLARLDNSPVGGVQQFVSQHRSLRLAPFTVREFYLYASELQPSGAVYRCLATYPLRLAARESG